MKATLYVPYSNGDAYRGFQYEKGNITLKEYNEKLIKDHKEHSEGVNSSMRTQFGNNLALNMFQKEKRRYKAQTYFYDLINCVVYNINKQDCTIDELINYHKTGEQFIVIVQIVNIDSNPDIEEDLKPWIKEAVKITRSDLFTDEEKLKGLSKKTLKIAFEGTRSGAVLKDCKMVEVYSKTRFALLVDNIKFTKEQ